MEQLIAMRGYDMCGERGGVSGREESVFESRCITIFLDVTAGA